MLLISQLLIIKIIPHVEFAYFCQLADQPLLTQVQDLVLAGAA